jgi:hypothetical protein
MKRMLRMHEVSRGRMKSKALPCMKFMLLLQHEKLVVLHASSASLALSPRMWAIDY